MVKEIIQSFTKKLQLSRVPLEFEEFLHIETIYSTFHYADVF